MKRVLKYLVYFGLLIFLCVSFGCEITGYSNLNTYDDPNGENDTMSSAIEIFETTSYEDYQADDDWFKIYVNPDFLYIDIDCYFTNGDGDIDIALYDDTGTLLEESTSMSNNEQIDYVVESADTYYYIQVYGENSGSTYQISWNNHEATLESGTANVAIQ